MPRVNFVLQDGSTKATEGAGGDSLMQVAVNNTVPGIEAVCGGFCNCATCHVYVDAAWVDRVPPVCDDEDAMLDGTASDRLPNSRLSCQLKITLELDGIVVVVPERQA